MFRKESTNLLIPVERKSDTTFGGLMENSKKKDLAKIALAAFMLSASLPAAGNASFDAESQGTLLAGGGCGDHTNKSSATSSCNATPGRISPASSRATLHQIMFLIQAAP